MRFVRAPGGSPVLDLKEDLPGRGAWVLPERIRVVRAAKGGFARAFKEQLAVPGGPEGFADAVGAQLAAQALARLGLARRAGRVLTGYDTVRGRASELIGYLSPHDASDQGTSRVARTVAAAASAPHLVLPADAEVLGGAVGQPPVVHLGLLPGGGAEKALSACTLWVGYDPVQAPQS